MLRVESVGLMAMATRAPSSPLPRCTSPRTEKLLLMPLLPTYCVSCTPMPATFKPGIPNAFSHIPSVASSAAHTAEVELDPLVVVVTPPVSASSSPGTFSVSASSPAAVALE